MVITNGFWFSQLLTPGDLIPLDQGLLAASAGTLPPSSGAAPSTRPTPTAFRGHRGPPVSPGTPRFIQTPVPASTSYGTPPTTGRVGMLDGIQDVGNVGMLKLGIDPEASTGPTGGRRPRRSPGQRDGGQVRGYYQQSYIDELTKRADLDLDGLVRGHLPAEPLLRGPTAVRHPGRGRHLWTDNMVIPRFAQNPVDTMMLIDWYYRPEIAAQLTESINYISAVPAAQRVIARDAARPAAPPGRCCTRSPPASWSGRQPRTTRRLYNCADVTGNSRPFMSRSSTRSSVAEPVARRRGPGAATRALRGAPPASFWLDRPDAPRPRRALRGNATADLAVVGGGFTGLWTALLAKERDPARDVVLSRDARGLGGVRPQRRLLLGQPDPRPGQRLRRSAPRCPRCTGWASRTWTRSRPPWRVTPSTADSSGPVS